MVGIPSRATQVGHDQNNDPAKNVIRSGGLTAQAIGTVNGRTRLRLDGHLTMRHDFYHKPDGKVVHTGLIGYADLDPAKGLVTRLRLATDGATYNGGRFAVVIEAVEK